MQSRNTKVRSFLTNTRRVYSRVGGNSARGRGIGEFQRRGGQIATDTEISD